MKQNNWDNITIIKVRSLGFILFILMFSSTSNSLHADSQRNNPNVISLKQKLEQNKLYIERLKNEKKDLLNNTNQEISLSNSINEDEKEIINKMNSERIDSSFMDHSLVIEKANEICPKLRLKTKNIGIRSDFSYSISGEFSRILDNYLSDKEKNGWRETDENRLKSYIKQYTDLYDKNSVIQYSKKLTDTDREIIYEAFLEISKYQDYIADVRKKSDSINQQDLSKKENIDKAIEIDNKIKEAYDTSKSLEHAIAVKTNQIKPTCIDDYALLYDASTDNTYTYKPPIDGPSSKKYYKWSGKLTAKDDGLYIVWNANFNPMLDKMNKSQNTIYFDPISIKGFAFKNIKFKFRELKQGEYITVVGKYTSNTKILLINGEKRIIPILSDCYVE